MSVPFVKVNKFVQNLGRKVFNLHTDTLKILLTNSVPDATTVNGKADLTEITAEHGYSAGGPTVSGTTWAQTSGTANLTGTDTVITASGGTVGPFRVAVLYDDTAASDEILGYYDYGSSITLADGGSFTIDFPTNLISLS